MSPISYQRHIRTLDTPVANKSVASDTGRGTRGKRQEASTFDSAMCSWWCLVKGARGPGRRWASPLLREELDGRSVVSVAPVYIKWVDIVARGPLKGPSPWVNVSLKGPAAAASVRNFFLFQNTGSSR